MELQEYVEAMEREKKELVGWQTKATDKALAMNSCVTELEQERTRLRQQLEDAQVEPPAAVMSLPQSMMLYNHIRQRPTSWRGIATKFGRSGINCGNRWSGYRL